MISKLKWSVLLYWTHSIHARIRAQMFPVPPLALSSSPSSPAKYCFGFHSYAHAHVLVVIELLLALEETSLDLN
eukprot:753295-Hanusia_phi.AAC.4